MRQGDLAVGGLLRSALDLFAARGEAADVKAGEEALQGLRDGVCCTGAGAPATGMAANVTCVRWLREHALVATADRCVSGVASKLEFRGVFSRLWMVWHRFDGFSLAFVLLVMVCRARSGWLRPGGAVEYRGFASPPLCLDACGTRILVPLSIHGHMTSVMR